MELLRAECVLQQPDIVMITESFCREDISDAYLSIAGYQTICRRDGRDTAGGRGRGLLTYVREGIPAGELMLEGGNLVTECCGVTIPWGRGEELKLVLVYRPPAAPGSPADGGNTSRLCSLLRTLGGKTVIIGDFNLPNIDWTRRWSPCAGERMVLDTVGDMFWEQMVHVPTHRLGNTLDLCLTSSLELFTGVEVVAPLGNSDHMGLEVSLVGRVTDVSSKEEVPDWEKADLQGMREKLETFEWEEEFAQLRGTECMERLYEVLDKVTREFVPSKHRRTGRRPMWMNANIMRMLRRKRRLWKAFSGDGYYRQDYRDFMAYQEVQKEIRKQIRKAKKKLERNLARRSKMDPKKFYSYLKSKTSNRVSVGPLVGREGIVTDNREMAEILNAQYTGVFTREDTTNLPDPEHLFTGEDPLTEVEFKREEVEKKLKNIKADGAPGPDKLWSKVLHDMADLLAGPLTTIYSKLMEEGDVPDVWRSANVCPVFKKGAKGDPANYRPVSLTCVAGKVMESLIRDKMVGHLERHNLIRPSQHGFMAGRSTATNMLEYMETLTRLLDQGHAVDVLYLDFAKAFDKVPHERLLAKCRGLGLGGKLLEWIRLWLSDRKQRVVLNGEASEWTEVLSGVPQGSVLGPTLFLIFINDIDRAVEVTSTILLKFADDTKVGRVVENEEQRGELQSIIDKLVEWSKEWQMLFNAGKCHILHLGARNVRHEYTMEGNKLEAVEVEKDVGVLVHQSLKPSMQCARAASRANAILGQLSRAITYRDKATFLKLYKVYVRPHLEYAVVCWSPWTEGDKEVLEKVQRRAIGMVTNWRERNYEGRLREAGMMSLVDRRLRGDMIATYKVMSGKDKVDPGVLFTLPGKERLTRHTAGVHPIRSQVEKPKLDIRRNTFSQRVVTPWNSLPDRVKAVGSVDGFKAMYDKWVRG